MVNKLEFIIHLEYIIQYEKHISDFENDIGKYSEDKMFFCTPFRDIIDHYIQLLAKDDKEVINWITWYLYETDCGKKTNVVTFNEQEYPITNISELYDIIYK